MPWISDKVHIYRADDQPATRFELPAFDVGKKPHVITNKPGRLLQCGSCYRKRRAKNMIAHAYYDGINYFCRDKEYGRSRGFPFAYKRICKGTAFRKPC